MRRLTTAIVLTLVCTPTTMAAADNDDIDATSNASGTSTVVVDNGTTLVGGGYAGADGVMTCSWYSVGDRPGSTHESYAETSVEFLVQGLTYYFQCFSLATGERIEADWRIYDPPAGNPIANLDVIATTYATQALDHQPLPPPTLHTAPPTGSPNVINISTWIWTTTPPIHTATTYIDPNNNSTVTATPTHITLNPGDGTPPTICAPNPTPWQPGADDDDPNSCQHTYTQPGTYTLVATLEWQTTHDSYIAGQHITGNLGTRQTQTTITITATEVLTHIQ